MMWSGVRVRVDDGVEVADAFAQALRPEIRSRVHDESGFRRLDEQR